MGGECDDVKSKQGVLENIEAWVGLGPSNSMERAVEAAKKVETVVVCVGEEAYAEKPGDIRSLELPSGQNQLVQELKSRTEAKIVLVYTGGRPRLLSSMADQVDAVVLAFLPGPWGGPALSRLLSGELNFSGSLPITYPRFQDGGGSPYFRAVSDQCNQGDGPLPHYPYSPCAVQWPFGHGLSYTSFSYSELKVRGGHGEDLNVSVTVSNIGSVKGSDVVMVFTFDEYRSTTPEYKRLRDFVKVELEPGKSQTVTMIVPSEDLKYIGPHDDTHYISDPSVGFYVGIGADTDCRSQSDSELCQVVSPKEKKSPLGYEAACEAACRVWQDSGCGSQLGLSPRVCLEMCEAISSYPNTLEGGVGTDGWGWNYVSCLESVAWGLGDQDKKQCWKMRTMCRDIFTTGKLDEFGRGFIEDRGMSAWESRRFLPNLVALFASILSAAFMIRAVRGLRFKRSSLHGSPQFERVDTDVQR